MPFGLKIAPAVFQEVMTTTLGDRIGNGVLVYIDDIIIYSKEIAQGRRLLKNVLERLTKVNLKLNKDKCQYEMREIEYLGLKVTGDGYFISDSALMGSRI
jgi:hypothetical protein